MSRRRFPSITDPTPSVDGLFATILDLKQHAEVVAGTRGELGPSILSSVGTEFLEPVDEWLQVVTISVPVQAGDIVRLDAQVPMYLKGWGGLRITRNRVAIWEPHVADGTGPFGFEGASGTLAAVDIPNSTGGHYRVEQISYVDVSPMVPVALYAIEARYYENDGDHYMAVNLDVTWGGTTDSKSIVIAQRFTPNGL